MRTDWSNAYKPANLTPQLRCVRDPYVAECVESLSTLPARPTVEGKKVEKEEEEKEQEGKGA